MTTVLSPSLLNEFSAYLEKEIGLYYPKNKWSDLVRGMQAASKTFQFEDVGSCIQWLMSSRLSQKQIETLASCLTIGETYFFRDSTVFQTLKEHILTPLIYKRRLENNQQLRLWSAGCASGEEVYSISIVLNELLHDINSWNISLLATDINTEFLDKLTKGVYTEWSFRDIKSTIKKTYFNEISKEKYEISPLIKKIVEPFYLNLCQDTYPSLINKTNAMDVIFCRNVLIYFSPNLIKKIFENFFNCLVDDGCLIVGSSELSLPNLDLFQVEFVNGVNIFRKKKQEVININNEDIKFLLPEPKLLKKEVLAPNYKVLAQQCANEGKLQEALLWNDKAISKNKTDESLYYLRGIIQLELGNDEEAIRTLNTAIFLNTNLILAYVVLGNIFHKQRKRKEAIKYFDHALMLLKNIDSNVMLGEITAKRLIEVVSTMKDLE